ncbi:putative protein E4 [human papillomavirus 89]|uniref:Uncharacterized protein E4 n=1 Tax=human papillomavirus 89 TaxID=202250 RepID=Q8JTB9_9PAPI|nr:putative protein E4 [human papillomavirus 89]
MGIQARGRCIGEALLFTMHAHLYLVPRTLCEKYPLLQLVTGYTTPPHPLPAPTVWAPPRQPPRCRRRLISDSDSTETECSSPPQQHKSTWTVATGGSTVTLTAQNDSGSRIVVTLHL